ncbi:MAG: tRNA(Met) cytidine acetyltransferase TmcA [Halodesulfurarchaeum sp.]
MEWSVAAKLAREARAHDERRVLVIAGAAESAGDPLAAAKRALDAAEIPLTETTLVGPEAGMACEHLTPARAGSLLGTTRSAVVLDCRDACRPNTLGTVVGAVDGGGLLVLLTPTLDAWPDRRDGFDEGLAVPPDTLADVTGHFRERLVRTLRTHPGIAIVDLGAAGDGAVRRDGLTHAAPRRPPEPITEPAESVPDELLEACLTQDQVDAAGDLLALPDGPAAAVLAADRGRGKSSVAGLVAAWYAHRGETIVVTGPQERAATAFFDRVAELLDRLGTLEAGGSEPTRHFETTSGGSIRFVPASDLSGQLDSADAVFVEEAAALPVGTLESTLSVDRLVFITTLHGYEGSGRGFAVRFRDRLEAARHAVREISLADPIRYAGGDPVEVWATRALLLGASPVPDSVVAEATPERVTDEHLTTSELVADEALLGEVFGLLVTAHYRTEPDDLARMLDGSNLAVWVLRQNGHVVAVALLAREGGLPAGTRESVYRGQRIRGNMLPDVLMSQLRDESAGAPVGLRVVRIATHHAVRSRGLGSHLLDRIREEFAPIVDWIGSGFGATPELVRFWRENGYRPVHLSTGRNDRSGEHSVLMLRGTSPAGDRLAAAHGRWFAARIGGNCADSLAAVDPAVIRATLDATARPPPLSLSPHQWRVIVGAAFGPGLYSVDPAPFRSLVVHGLIDGNASLSDRAAHLLIEGVLQLRGWDRVAADLDFASRTAAMRALGEALQPLVETYGPPEAQRERRRFEDP